MYNHDMNIYIIVNGAYKESGAGIVGDDGGQLVSLRVCGQYGFVGLALALAKQLNQSRVPVCLEAHMAVYL